MKYTKEQMEQRIEDYLLQDYIRSDGTRIPIVAYRIAFAKEDELIGIYDSISDVVANLNISAPSVKKSLETGCAIKGITFMYPHVIEDETDPFVRKIIL